MKILYVTTIGSTMEFFYEHFKMLIKEGYEIELACGNAKTISEEIASLASKSHTISFSRLPITMDNLKAYKQLKKLIEHGNYDIVHCHTPNASVITRLVCQKFRKKDGLKVFYTAHGFHFYKGAPLKNWVLYYPIEKICARFTDKLLTINQEDYALAQKKFEAKEICYVPGVGINLSKFQDVQVDKSAKRREIGVPEDCLLLLSVGELNENKNHQVIIRALAQLDDRNIHYAIAGVGDKKDYLIKLSEDLGVLRQIHLLGYRTDVAQLYKAADIYALPSIREGLNMSIMEAMASGLPVVCSKIRGNLDLIDENGGALFDPQDIHECSAAINIVISVDRKTLGERNRKAVQAFSIDHVLPRMKEIYNKDVEKR